MADATETDSSLRQCPTRIDGAAVRIAQHIPLDLCQDRQRGLYHKCFLCEHANGRVPQGDVESAARAVAPNGPDFGAAERHVNGPVNGHVNGGKVNGNGVNGQASPARR